MVDYEYNGEECSIRRPWEYDIDATHRDKENIYMFNWKGKRVAVTSISTVSELTKEKKPKFIFICN